MLFILTALPVMHAAHEPEMLFARHQRNRQRGTLMVVISGDGELLTNTPSGVACEMRLVRTAFNTMSSLLFPLKY